MTTLVDNLVPDELWGLVAPLLPIPPRPPYGGRRRAVPDRNCFAAIVYRARTSTPWRLLPTRQLGCGSPATRWRRLTEWAAAGVFDALHLEVLDRLGAQGELDWSRVRMDTMSVRAKRGGPRGRKSSHRGKPGSKLHPVCDGAGLPLAAAETAANVNDTTMLTAVLDDVPPVRTPSGRWRTRPGTVHADKGYDSHANRAYLRRRGIRPRIARGGIEPSTRLGRHRGKVERSLSWLSCWRRLQVRWDRDWGPLVWVRAGGLCGHLLQPARTSRRKRDVEARFAGVRRAPGPRGRTPQRWGRGTKTSAPRLRRQ
jgi:transposase/IS5 family transposase